MSLTGVVTSEVPCGRCDGADVIRDTLSEDGTTREVLSLHACLPAALDALQAEVRALQAEVLRLVERRDG